MIVLKTYKTQQKSLKGNDNKKNLKYTLTSFKFGELKTHRVSKYKNKRCGWLADLFYGMSTLVDYLMSNPVYTYIKYICKQIVFRLQFFNEQELVYLYTVKWFQVLLLIVCTLLNGFRYCYLILIILFNLNH